MRLAPCFTRVWCQSLMTQQWIAVRLRDLQLYCIHLSTPNLSLKLLLFKSISPQLNWSWTNFLHCQSFELEYSESVYHLCSRRTSDKVCMMYKIINGLVDANPVASLLALRNSSTRGHKLQLQVFHSRKDTYLHYYFQSAIQLWNSVPTGAPWVVTLPVFRSALTGWMEGHA